MKKKTLIRQRAVCCVHRKTCLQRNFKGKHLKCLVKVLFMSQNSFDDTLL